MKPNSLWSFSTTVYQKEGVAAACLTLQSQRKVDIPMLFAVALACSQGKEILKEDVNKLQSMASPWQTNIVQALRHIRTQLKTGPHPAPNITTAELRERVKAIELAAEEIQIEMMQSWVKSLATIYPKNSSPKLPILINSITIFVTANCDAEITLVQHEHIHCIGNAALQHILKLEESA